MCTYSVPGICDMVAILVILLVMFILVIPEILCERPQLLDISIYVLSICT